MRGPDHKKRSESRNKGPEMSTENGNRKKRPVFRPHFILKHKRSEYLFRHPEKMRPSLNNGVIIQQHSTNTEKGPTHLKNLDGN